MNTVFSGRLFLEPCTFVAGCTEADNFPATRYPEIAFAGRSNVGKSSLMNALTGQKGLARTSSTPGRTREINFFLLAETLMLVDLPGFGYAKASGKDIARWTSLVASYLSDRPTLRRVCLLIDARHGVKPIDDEVMDLLDDAAISYQIVLTKSDKVAPAVLEGVCESVRAALSRHAAAHPHIIATSSQHKDGISELRTALAGLVKRK